jgi:hypothetical protein
MVVNVALIVTGQALAQFAHDAGRLAHTVDWTPQREPFRVFCEHGKLFEAQVDGHLSTQTNAGPGEPKMCAEVKADIRAAAVGVYFQEAAQLAAWIASERADGRQAEILWNKDGKYRFVDALSDCLFLHLKPTFSHEDSPLPHPIAVCYPLCFF